ncbi:lactonase family protein [Sinomonas terrae]|uniref:Lactonase family protein n=1 Tax=Sinomonas terrae TaxID=2908838 RepID=A0ABS9TXH1_9MICC|nr:beta-propeller fold lactonase family protein [Sinomonas terrae]MCH6469131.1 lactonase family protein [Sinomonas terrae]
MQGANASRSLVYIACATAGTVDAFELDPESGALERIGRTEGLSHASSMALDPESRTLYAACNIDRPSPEVPPRVVALSLDAASGEASVGGTRELPVTTCYVSLTPDRRELFGASYHEGRLIRFPVPGAEENGVSTYASGANTHCAVVSPDGRYVYAASLGDDRVSWFAVDGRAERAVHDGAIAPSGHVAVEHGSGPRHLRFSSDGERVYVLHELSGDVSVFERDPDNGHLALLQVVSAVDGLDLSRGAVRSPSTQDPGQSVIWCADLRLTPDGRFLFATERSTSTVSAFAVRGGGLIEFLGRTPTEAQPRGTAIDPSGRFLLVCGERSDHVTAYRIGDDGSLTLRSRARTSGGPLWIECWAPA